MECHGNTLLPQFLGMYRLTVDGVETYMVVTRNVFSHRLTVHRKYDLKVRVWRAVRERRAPFPGRWELVCVTPTLQGPGLCFLFGGLDFWGLWIGLHLRLKNCSIIPALSLHQGGLHICLGHGKRVEH